MITLISGILFFMGSVALILILIHECIKLLDRQKSTVRRLNKAVKRRDKIISKQSAQLDDLYNRAIQNYWAN